MLLAASSAKIVGHPDADGCSPISAKFSTSVSGKPAHGASAEEFAADWSPISAYRGQNSNMHLTEALMAAFEATGERAYLAKAESIADLILRRMAGSEHWRVPEHYHADWTIDREYKGSDMFRPYGTTPGHWLEWARLAMQLWELGERRIAWLPDAAKGLFARSDQRRLGRSARRLLLHGRLGAAARASATESGGRAARESARPLSSPRMKAASFTRTGIGASGAFQRVISSIGAWAAGDRSSTIR